MEKNKHLISEKELDTLLKHSFLNHDFAGNTEVMTEQLGNRLLVKFPTGILFKTGLAAIVAVSIVIALVWLLPLKTQPLSSVKQQVAAPGKNEQGSTSIKETAKPLMLQAPKKEPRNNNNSHNTTAAAVVVQDQTAQATSDIAGEIPANVPIDLQVQQQPEEAYIFPNLTEKEKKANDKEKKRMARQAARLPQEKGFGKYVLIQAGASMPNYYMGGGEVTNLDYRTFLFDLLINGRKEDFLIAKPDQQLWINAGGVHTFDTLSQVYFSEKKYNDYPVVNIIAAGAQMYCRWLSELANELRLKENKPAVEFKLPTEQQWLYAASSGQANTIYAWPLSTVQNSYNLFLGNFCIKKKTEKLSQPVKYPGKSNPAAYTSAGMAMNDGRVASTTVWAYNPNDFYLYVVCGNVSEMVYSKNSIKTKGGNWNSDFEHIQLNSEDEFKENPDASPMIGFRVCATVKP